MKRRILFLCTANACRSQMAEGLLRRIAGDRYESCSAGSNPAGYIHPLAVQVMAEVGVDVSGQRSKGLEEFLGPGGCRPEVVVSLCEFAGRRCPTFPANVARLHWPVVDPILAEGNEEIRLSLFRAVRDEIHGLIEDALAAGELDRPPAATTERRTCLGKIASWIRSLPGAGRAGAR